MPASHEEPGSGFAFDAVLAAGEICNYDEVRRELVAGLATGRKFVVYGRRNTGKTSLIRSLVLPALARKGAFTCFCDLLGVRSISQVRERLRSSLERSLTEAFPARARLDRALELLRSLRPTLKTDPIEGLSVSLELDPGRPLLPIPSFFDAVSRIHAKSRAIIAFDEFQDLHFVEQGEALFRDAMQNLPRGLGVVVMGSKRHLLADIFARPQAPLAGFGEDIELPPIPYEEYARYMNERFRRHDLKAGVSEAREIQDLVQRIPEAVNIVCAEIIRNLRGTGRKEITSAAVHHALACAVERRAGRFEEHLSRYTEGEQRVLAVLARMGPVPQPSGARFVAACGLSQKGVSKIIRKLEGEAAVFRAKEGYIVGEPLLAYFLLRYR